MSSKLLPGKEYSLGEKREGETMPPFWHLRSLDMVELDIFSLDTSGVLCLQQGLFLILARRERLFTFLWNLFTPICQLHHWLHG